MIVSPTTHIYTLSLHDALPIYAELSESFEDIPVTDRHTNEAISIEDITVHATPELADSELWTFLPAQEDRRSTRLNSSHLGISYAVFCLKKKTNKHDQYNRRMI